MKKSFLIKLKGSVSKVSKGDPYFLDNLRSSRISSDLWGIGFYFIYFFLKMKYYSEIGEKIPPFVEISQKYLVKPLLNRAGWPPNLPARIFTITFK